MAQSGAATTIAATSIEAGQLADAQCRHRGANAVLERLALGEPEGARQDDCYAV